MWPTSPSSVASPRATPASAAALPVSQGECLDQTFQQVSLLAAQSKKHKGQEEWCFGLGFFFYVERQDSAIRLWHFGHTHPTRPNGCCKGTNALPMWIPTTRGQQLLCQHQEAEPAFGRARHGQGMAGQEAVPFSPGHDLGFSLPRSARGPNV